MKKTLLILAAFFAVTGLYAQNSGASKFRNFSINDSSSLKVIGADTFRLSASYPTELPEKASASWEKIDFKKKPESFMKAVLNYCWSGNEEVNFDAFKNTERAWYHAPWMDAGYAGREPMHGLVMDNTLYSDDFNTEAKNKKARNYSLTLYNDRAAYTLGQVWADPSQPDASKAEFAEGSVFFTLVFTTADSSMLPFLKNAYSWEALIEKKTSLPIDQKGIDIVNLLEVNLAVRSSKAPNGWVMGSFIYNGNEGGDTKSHLIPSALQWGNDPGITPAMLRAEEEPAQLTESWINSASFNSDDKASGLMTRMGFAGRARRVIGSSNGSILSEAMTAGWPPAPVIAPETVEEMDSVLHWFRNIGHGNPFMKDQVSLDFCLELKDGMRNHAISYGDSLLGIQREAELGEVLGFIPPDRSSDYEEEEEVVIDYDQGLEGRNLYVFIGFIVLIVVIVGLLIMNIVRK